VPPAPAKNLHEDLVAPGRKRGAGNDLAPHGKEPAHGVGDLREEHAPERGDSERNDPPLERPFFDIPAFLFDSKNNR